VENYSLDQLSDDLANLAKALGREKIILFGHDWGGLIGYHVCYRHPDLVGHYIVTNCPHLQSIKRQLIRGWHQAIKSWYFLAFQAPYLAEYLAHLVELQVSESFPQFRADRRPSDEVLACYKYTFRKPGAFTDQ
jgi:pimeloyl-ACP methyl ester carboxylesterase